MQKGNSERNKDTAHIVLTNFVEGGDAAREDVLVQAAACNCSCNCNNCNCSYCWCDCSCLDCSCQCGPCFCNCTCGTCVCTCPCPCNCAIGDMQLSASLHTPLHSAQYRPDGVSSSAATYTYNSDGSSSNTSSNAVSSISLPARSAMDSNLNTSALSSSNNSISSNNSMGISSSSANSSGSANQA